MQWHPKNRIVMFRSRADAGRKLAERLTGYAIRQDVLVLGIPRGGVLVAFEVAQALRAPLDVLLVRKLGTPGQEELAMGAIASGGARVLNQQLIAELGITEEQITDTIAREEAELQRRELMYRGARPGISANGKIVILVDDGIATGSSMIVAVDALRTLHPQKIVVAVPVAPGHAERQLIRIADEFVCVQEPEWFFAIGEFYANFPQTTDAEVRAVLEHAARPLAAALELDAGDRQKTSEPGTRERENKRGIA
jgi:putative phosphoribosyl transferase